jgi:two-component system phosphate regulon sensor histidine kinase PhoR
MKDLKRILILRYTLLVAIVLVVVALLVIIPLRSFSISNEKENLEEEAQIFAREYQVFFSEELAVDEIDAYLEDIAEDLPTRLTVIDADGVVLGDSQVPAEAMDNHAGRPEIAAALQGEVASSTRESRTIGKNFIYAAAPIEINGEVAGVARVSLAEEDVMPVVYQIWWIFLVAFGILLVVIIAVSIWTERTIIGGLRGMSEAAADLAAGDLSRRVAEPDIKDFSELARDFNDMAEQVRRQVEEAAEERGKLETVLDNISTGIMVTDAERRVVLLNPAAEEILGVRQGEALGNRIIESFSSRELDTTVSKAADGESIDEQIELLYPQRMYLQIKSNPVVSSEGDVVATVSAIEDITALKRLNMIRQDFVANVSHELRTPVASVKALTDSLLAGAAEEKETADRFLKDLDQEVTRLSQLIEDLLTLSKLETKEAVLQLEEIPLGEIVKECLDSKDILAEEFDVDLEVELDDAQTLISGDRQLLRTALNNLVDNAIKYNHSGGKVVIKGLGDYDHVILQVRDTGIGIPRDELPRIFERFYRVDKARSRETGGTGLGLSIVKHIADLHGGGVDVTSVEGEGSTFSIRIPNL